MAGTFVIAQGGGPTAVINQTMVGAALEIRKRHPGARVLGARHGVRGIRDGDYVEPVGSSGSGTAAHRRHAERSPRLDPRQAGRRLLRTRAERSAEGRRRSLHLYWRQRHVRHPADPHRRLGRLDRLRPCAEDHRQRSGGERPHAGLHVGRRIYGRRLPHRRPRLPGAAWHLCGDRHGPACRLPDGRIRRLAHRRGLRAASDLRAGARLLAETLHR